MKMISNSAVRRGFPTQLFIQRDNIPPLKILFSKKIQANISDEHRGKSTQKKSI